MNTSSEVAIEFADRSVCPICHGTRFTTLHDFDRIPVVTCDECGFMFSARVFTPRTLDHYYGNNFGSDRHRAGQSINARVNIRALSALLPLPQLKTALDVGCGYGYLLKCLATRGLACKGLEPSKIEAAHARAMGFEVENSMLRDATNVGQFDLVASFEVIEHTPDPLAFARNAARHVGPNGFLVIMTDNFNSPIVSAMGACFPKWIPHSHISHFTGESLAAMLAKLEGFRLHGVVSFTPWELWASYAMRRVRGREPKFVLSETLASEMQGEARMTGFRRAVDPWWFSLSARRNLRGQLVYVAMQRGAPET